MYDKVKARWKKMQDLNQSTDGKKIPKFLTQASLRMTHYNTLFSLMIIVCKNKI